jgi:hypothetical protein
MLIQPLHPAAALAALAAQVVPVALAVQLVPMAAVRQLGAVTLVTAATVILI